MATCCRLDGPGRSRDFSLLYGVQTGSGALLSSEYRQPLSLEVRRLDRKADHSLPFSTDIHYKSYTFISPYAFMEWYRTN
jgi:hypothetical protein